MELTDGMAMAATVPGCQNKDDIRVIQVCLGHTIAFNHRFFFPR